MPGRRRRRLAGRGRLISRDRIGSTLSRRIWTPTRRRASWRPRHIPRHRYLLLNGARRLSRRQGLKSPSPGQHEHRPFSATAHQPAKKRRCRRRRLDGNPAIDGDGSMAILPRRQSRRHGPALARAASRVVASFTGWYLAIALPLGSRFLLIRILAKALLQFPAAALRLARGHDEPGKPGSRQRETGRRKLPGRVRAQLAADARAVPDRGGQDSIGFTRRTVSGARATLVARGPAGRWVTPQV